MSPDIHIIAFDPPENSVVFVERKGIGHPDTLADTLAEALSRNYSLYTQKRYGAVLHHNFDKTGILGGKSFVSFGKGRLTTPVKVLVNGRLSASFGGENIPYEKIISETVYEFFGEIFGNLIPHDMVAIEMNISSASSPGHADANTNGSARNNWFNPQSLDDLPEVRHLFSNDTSIGCVYYPMHPLETFVLDLERALTVGEFKKNHTWMGSDVKVMGTQIQDAIDITLCVPQIANFVSNLDEYKANLQEVRAFLD